MGWALASNHIFCHWLVDRGQLARSNIIFGIAQFLSKNLKLYRKQQNNKASVAKHKYYVGSHLWILWSWWLGKSENAAELNTKNIYLDSSNRRWVFTAMATKIIWSSFRRKTHVYNFDQDIWVIFLESVAAAASAAVLRPILAVAKLMVFLQLSHLEYEILILTFFHSPALLTALLQKLPITRLKMQFFHRAAQALD